jgi:ArsR family transcriptional regulator
MSIYDQLTALADPTRMRLMCLLVDEELSVGELTRIVKLAQSTVSRHLKQLQKGDWLSRRTAGPAAYFHADPNGYPPDQRELWGLARNATRGDPQIQEDRRRMLGVLRQRSTDSGAFFGRVANEWETMRADLFGDDFAVQVLASVMPHQWVVADLGCGTGDLVAKIAGSVARVIGVDRESAMLKVAQRRVSGLPGAELRRGTLDDLPLETDSLDAAFCNLVLHHVVDLEPVFDEASRVLRSGGVFIISDMVEHDREAYRATMGHQHLGFSRERLSSLGRASGFGSVDYRELATDDKALGPSLFVARLQQPHNGEPLG